MRKNGITEPVKNEWKYFDFQSAKQSFERKSTWLLEVQIIIKELGQGMVSGFPLFNPLQRT